MTSEPKFFYTNALEIAASPYDISLKFLRNGAEPKTPALAGKEGEATSVLLDTMVVSMSPSHFKAMLPGLLQAVHKYENQFGPIPLPPEFAEAWKSINETKKA